MRWCLTERDRGISTWQSLDCTDLVLRVGCRQGILNPPRCGTCCTCALWRTVRAPTILRCSRLSRGGYCSCSPTLAISRSARRCTLSSRVRCERGHEIHARKPYSRWERTWALYNIHSPFLSRSCFMRLSTEIFDEALRARLLT